MPNWLTDHWPFLAVALFALSGALWVALKSAPRQQASAIRRLNSEVENSSSRIKAAFHRIDEERTLRENLDKRVAIEFTKMDGGLAEIRQEIRFLAQSHEREMGAITRLMQSIEGKLDQIHDLDTRVVRLEEQVATITERGCALACPVSGAKGA